MFYLFIFLFLFFAFCFVLFFVYLFVFGWLVCLFFSFISISISRGSLLQKFLTQHVFLFKWLNAQNVEPDPNIQAYKNVIHAEAAGKLL